MPKLSVLVSKQGDVLGTFQESGDGYGTGAPVARLQPGPDQRVVEVEIDEATARLDPDKLHKRIKAKHLG
jgi:hypothetical protein